MAIENLLYLIYAPRPLWPESVLFSGYVAEFELCHIRAAVIPTAVGKYTHLISDNGSVLKKKKEQARREAHPSGKASVLG